MNSFEKEIELYKGFIKEGKVSKSQFPYYRKQIAINKKILRYLNEGKVTPKFLASLQDRLRWGLFKELKDVTWHCGNCGAKQDEPRSTFEEIVCYDCDYTLTRRTGGGQGDPFNWTFSTEKLKPLTMITKVAARSRKINKEIKKAELKKVIKALIRLSSKYNGKSVLGINAAIALVSKRIKTMR